MATKRVIHAIKKRIGKLSILAFVLFMVWAVFLPHKTETKGPQSLEDSSSCPIPLPLTARNIQYASWHQWNFFQEYVRFEAPVEDCRHHVPAVLAHWRKTFDDPMAYKDVGPLVPFTDPSDNELGLPIASGVVDVPWFDVHKIANGEAAGGGSGRPKIWIDLDRGIFYYRLLD